MKTVPNSSRSTGSPRFHALDVWRGLVCLLVVLEHAGVALWGGALEGRGIDGWVRQRIVAALELNIGTALFFVMSGYCIASSIASTRRRGTSPLVFMLRRLWRIFPPYWAALLVFVATVAALDAVGLEFYHKNDVSLALDSPGALSRAQWLGNLTLTETWRPILGGGEASVFTRVAWSLCYQEQFYLISFLAFLAFPARYGQALALATLGIVAFHIVAWDVGAIHRIAGTFPVHWHEFAVGLAVYWRLGPSAAAAARRGVELGLAVVLAVALAMGSIPTIAASGFGLVLIALSRWDDRLPGLRCLDPVRACGRRSYSLYLVHLPVVMLVNVVLRDLGLTGFWPRALAMIPAATAASLAAAWAFHRVVEHHFLELPACPRPAVLGAALAACGRRTVSAGTRAAALACGAGGRWSRVVAGSVLATTLCAAAASGLRSDLDLRPIHLWEAWMDRPAGWLEQHELQVRKAVATRAELVFLGDSITYNWGDESRDDRGSEIWRRVFAPLGAANLGAIGDRAEHLLWRVRHGALDSQPRVAVVLIGTNDLAAGRSPEQTAEGITAVVREIRDRSPLTRVLLLGVLPRHAYAAHPIREKVARVNDLISRLDDGEEVRVLDIGARFVRADGQPIIGLTSDFLHLSPDGYRLCARLLRSPIRRLLGTGTPVVGPLAQARPPRHGHGRYRPHHGGTG